MAPSMRTFSSFLFLVSIVHYKIYMSRFSLFPRVGEVNAWIEATVRAAGTSTPKGHCGRLPTWCARSWAESTRKHVPASHSNRSTCGCSRNDRVATQSHRVDTRGESQTKSMRRSCVEHLTETLSPQTEIWRLLLATKFQNEV